MVNDIQVVIEEGEESPSALHRQFSEDIYFNPVVRWIENKETGMDLKEARQVKYRAVGFMIDEGQLWRVAGKNS